jgi:transketolase
MTTLATKTERHSNYVLVLRDLLAREASEFGWEPYVGSRGHKIGMNTFGASAPLKELRTKSGFTTRRIVEAAKLQTTRQLT